MDSRSGSIVCDWLGHKLARFTQRSHHHFVVRRYGGDSRIAVQIVIATTIASLAMAPIWLRIAAYFIQL
jgi:hypothetical protein